MKIAILSDIHDNVWNLAIALVAMQAAEAMICCGDLCSPFIVNQLAGGFPDRPIHIVFGNNDGDQFRIQRNAAKYEHIHLHGELFQAELAGKRFACNHYGDIAMQLARSGQYDVVCYGHNHQYQVEQVGTTLTINPGAIMGFDPIHNKDIIPTFVILDTVTGEASQHQVRPLS